MANRKHRVAGRCEPLIAPPDRGILATEAFERQIESLVGVGRPECELTMLQSLLETIAGDMRLSAEQLEFIRSLWMPRDFRKRQFFQRAGEVTTHGAFVVRGCFRTYMLDARGCETIVHFSAERAFIGDITSAVIAMSLSASAEERDEDFVLRQPAPAILITAS